ncbi:MAG: elongation factor P [Candidatus Abawacabacteria bacterium]|nr:elongation factor P [Candidatus Abawacabacteria bacterium]
MQYTELRKGTKIIIDNEPWIVADYEFMRMQQRKATVKCILKNLITGRTLHKTFQPSDNLEEANMENRRTQFLYREGDTFSFMDQENFEQFEMNKEQLGDNIYYLLEGHDVDVMYFKGRPVILQVPAKVTLRVTETPPGVRGDTATGGSKKAKLETGLNISVPLYIEEGELIKVNTETGEFVERVKESK